MKKAFIYLPLVITVIFFILILFLYLHNITRDVYAGDIGDIASAAALFGVPHPPGYPLITILGFIFYKSPLPLPSISKIALVSVISSIIGLVVYFLFALKVAKIYFTKIKINKKLNKLDFKNKKVNKKAFNLNIFTIFKIKKVILEADAPQLSAAILSTSVLAFSYYFWLYAVVPEVFAMNHLILISLYFFAFLFYQTKNNLYLYLTAFFVGLSFTNQQAVMFAFPGLLILLLPEVGNIIINNSPKKKTNTFLNFNNLLIGFKNSLSVFNNVFNKAVFAFFLGLIPYLYVFISAAANPQINWLKEPTLNNFIRLLLRMDYSFAENLVGINSRFIIQQIYFSNLINNYSLIILLVAVIGLVSLFRLDKRLFSALLTGFIFAGPLFIFIITPEISDPDELGTIERMFMQSYVLLSFFLPFGFYTIQNFFYKFLPRKVYKIIFLLPFFIVVLQMVSFNYQKTDLSKTKIGSNFAFDILEPLPKNAVVFLKGDIGTFNSWYIHYVEGYRKDIDLANFIGDRNDFANGIIKDYKKNNINTSLSNEEIVMRKLPDILNTRRIYSMYQYKLYSKDYIWLPRGLVFELVPVSKLPTKDEYLKQVSRFIRLYNIAYKDKLLLSEQNNIAPNISKQYSSAYINIGDFLYVQYADSSNAFGYYTASQIIDPSNHLSYAKMAIIQSEIKAQCSEAIENIDTSIGMYKIYRPYYTFALKIYKKCNASEDKLINLKIRYNELFGKELEKDLHF